MGYRSEVAYAVRLGSVDEDTQKQLASNEINLDDVWAMFIAEIKTKCDRAFASCEWDNGEIGIKIDDKARTLRFHEIALKWYEEYEDVQSHEKILDIANEYNQRYKDDYNLPELFDVAFVRIGEEEEDCETRYGGINGNDLLYPIRYIGGDMASQDH